MATETYLIKCDIRALNHIFHKSIRQVIIMNEQIVNMKARYERARKSERRSFRYATRLRLCAIEGTRNMFYEFAAKKCEEIEALQEELRDISGEEYNFEDESSNFISDDDTDDEDEGDDEEDDEMARDEENVSGNAGLGCDDVTSEQSMDLS